MSLVTVRSKYLDFRAGDHVLDLGCGEGRHAISFALDAEVRVVAMDLRQQDLATTAQRTADFEAERNGEVFPLCASGLRLPFADATFDRVVCSEVLEHIIDYELVLDEIYRVLKPGGILAVSVPRFGPEWVCWKLSDAYHEVEGGHVRIFRAFQLDESVRKNSYRRFAKHHAHALHSPYWWLRCLYWEQGENHWLIKQYHRFLVWDLMKQPILSRVLEFCLNPVYRQECRALLSSRR